MKKSINSVAVAVTGISTLFGATAAIAGNRSHLEGVSRLPQARNTAPDISSIVNGQDRRFMVPLGGGNAAAFDAVGILKNGKESCTGTISEFWGYSTSYTLILTAAHCLNKQSAAGMTFTAATVNASGQPTTYHTKIIDWDVLQNNTHEIAILVAERSAPKTIAPALVISDYAFKAGQTIHTAGFAVDRGTDGMIAHVGGTVQGIYQLYVTTDLDIASGQSGSPIIIGINDAGTQLIVGGVINGVLETSRWTTLDIIPAYFLDESPFLVTNNGRKNVPAPRN